MIRPLLLLAVCAIAPLAPRFAIAHPDCGVPGSGYYYSSGAYHRQVELLDRQIELLKAEIAVLERQLHVWEPMDRFRHRGPLMVTIDDTRLLLMQAKIDLAQLENDRFEIVRHRGYR